MATVFLEALVQLGCVVDTWKTAVNAVWMGGSALTSGVTGAAKGVIDHFGLTEVRKPVPCSEVKKEYETKIAEMLHLPGGRCSQICNCGENVCQVGQKCEPDGKCIDSFLESDSNAFKSQIKALAGGLRSYFFSTRDDDAKAFLGAELYAIGQAMIKSTKLNPLQKIGP